MSTLGIDVGSSSVKSAILRADCGLPARVARAAFPTRYQGVRVEADANVILRAVANAIGQVGRAAKAADVIALSVMAPSWVAMDRRGKPITPVITHQDRRSVAEAAELEARVGKERYLSIAGNRPFPGGISCTTWAWHLRHAKGLMRRADLVGHFSTCLLRTLTGARAIDPSHASFTGLYRTTDLGGWSEELCDAVGVDRRQLPAVLPADTIAGRVTPAAARAFGLTAGTPVLAGMVDTGAAMLLAGGRPGQMVNISGSTDVLILCAARPHPHERVLTRALGVGERWTSVCTIAAAGSSLNWAKENLFPDLTAAAFHALMAKLARKPLPSAVRFEPYLAGDRMSMEQRTGAFTGLTLAATREQLLGAIIESLAESSAARLPLLRQGGEKMRQTVLVSGGVSGGLDKVLHRDWPGKWTFRPEEEATLRGLGMLEPKEA